MTHLGFSDHTPLPDNRWPEVRMPLCELSEYVSEIEEAQEKYNEIRIVKGAECEYAPEYLNFYKEELLGEYQFEYLVGGAHYFPFRGEWVNCYGADNSKRHLIAYSDYLITSIDCDLFAFIAHPDLFSRFYHKWDNEAIACSRAILDAASDKGRILEINGYGYRKGLVTTEEGLRRPYPSDSFWALASEYNVSVIINSDAHKPEDVDDFGEGFALAESLGLEIKELNIGKK